MAAPPPATTQPISMGQRSETEFAGVLQLADYPSSSYAWYVVIALTLAYVFFFIDRQILNLLLEAQRLQARDVSCCRNWYAGGDSIDPTLQEEWSNAFPYPLTEGYGLTEVLPAIMNVPGEARVGSFGCVVPGVEAKVCDELGRALPDGQTGELQLRARHLFAGYWQDPNTTAAVLREGWFATGDLAVRSSDGFFNFRGRIKQLIVRGGAKVAPQEVEAALVRHPSVSEAAVVGQPDPVLGEAVAAFVVVQPGDRLTVSELRTFARSQLAAYKVPETIFLLDALPKGPTGKADRRQLRERLLAELQAVL